MNEFFQRGLDEYLRQKDLQQEAFRQTESVCELIKKFESKRNFFHLSPAIRNLQDAFLLLLTPVIEVAWSNGRVTSREMDSILQLADRYELLENPEMYSRLFDRLLSRPTPKTVGEAWNLVHKLWQFLDEGEQERLALAIFVQTRFVAEQSSNNIISYLRGENICDDELAILDKIREEFKKMQLNQTEKTAKTRAKVEAMNAGATILTQNEMDKLLQIVPLIQVAWAEGYVTKRERELILKAAERAGIKPGSDYYRRINDWLELHPTDDFYNETLDLLSSKWRNLDAEDRTLRRLDLLSDCALVAEASGGGKGFVGGGPRICDEEITVVKTIAQKLSDRHPAVSV